MSPSSAEGKSPIGSARSLRQVRAAQLRVRAIRWALGKSALGTIFLIGALSYAFTPDPHARGNVVWMALLVVLSTFNIGLGLRTLAKVHPRAARYWLPGTLAWGLLATVMLKLLLRVNS